MTGSLLLRGMLAGLIAGLIAFGFAKVFGEPQVEIAIVFEEQMAAVEAATANAPAAMEEPELLANDIRAFYRQFRS